MVGLAFSIKGIALSIVADSQSIRKPSLLRIGWLGTFFNVNKTLSVLKRT